MPALALRRARRGRGTHSSFMSGVRAAARTAAARRVNFHRRCCAPTAPVGVLDFQTAATRPCWTRSPVCKSSTIPCRWTRRARANTAAALGNTDGGMRAGARHAPGARESPRRHKAAKKTAKMRTVKSATSERPPRARRPPRAQPKSKDERKLEEARERREAALAPKQRPLAVEAAKVLGDSSASGRGRRPGRIREGTTCRTASASSTSCSSTAPAALATDCAALKEVQASQSLEGRQVKVEDACKAARGGAGATGTLRGTGAGGARRRTPRGGAGSSSTSSSVSRRIVRSVVSAGASSDWLSGPAQGGRLRGSPFPFPFGGGLAVAGCRVAPTAQRRAQGAGKRPRSRRRPRRTARGSARQRVARGCLVS